MYSFIFYLTLNLMCTPSPCSNQYTLFYFESRMPITDKTCCVQCVHFKWNLFSSFFLTLIAPHLSSSCCFFLSSLSQVAHSNVVYFRFKLSISLSVCLFRGKRSFHWLFDIQDKCFKRANLFLAFSLSLCYTEVFLCTH